jgi:hypothetical protein
MVQEIGADKTVTYLYEPDSFVPLARIGSPEGIGSYSLSATHIIRARFLAQASAARSPR